jgi:indole-3-glycerol phosphate synthase
MSAPGASTVLERIVAETRADVDRRKQELPLDARGSASVAPAVAPERFSAAVAAPGLGVIAEFKRRSPSAGELRAGASVEELVRAYERGGAVALSVLTERANFGGSIEDLRAARAATDLPILRKDFIVDPYQLHEARAAGADAVLLIVAALSQEQLRALHAQARALALDALVEVHDRAELGRALDMGARTVGINNRDLRDLSVDVRRTFDLLAEVPHGVAVVSESGIAHAAQLRRLAEAGVDAALVGESLMRARDPAAALSGLKSLPSP